MALTIGLTGAFMYWRTTAGSHGPSNPLAFPPVRVDTKRLEAERRVQRRLDEKVLDSKAVAKLHELVRRANVHHFETSTGSDKPGTKAARLGTEISLAANEVVRRTGWDGFVGAGRPIFEACREGLRTLLAGLREGELELKVATTSPPPETYRTYRRNCGNLLPRLLDLGLVEESGHWAAPPATSRAVVGILQRLRWAHIVASRRRPILQLTDYEREILFRWRLANDEGFSSDRRRRFLEKIRKQTSLAPGIDTTLAAARLAFQTGDRSRAKSILEGALADDEVTRHEKTYERALKWLKSRKGQASGSDETASEH